MSVRTGINTPGISTDCGEKAARRKLDHVDHPGKPSRAAVIGIGHVEPAEGGREFEQQLELNARAGGTQGVERGVVAPVHRDHVVEVAEIVDANLAGAQAADVDGALQRFGLGVRIGRLADVPVARAGGVGRDLAAKPVALDEVAEDAFRRRRATNIAETDEQNLDHTGPPYRSCAEYGVRRERPNPHRQPRVALTLPMTSALYRHIVILTGAGISAESGLGTFRDADGLWTKYDLDDVATPHGFARNPALVYDFYNARRRTLLAAAPNAAHYALARLEREHAAKVVIVTQNVDNLHERAGSDNVIHMHGELLKTRCTTSHHVFAWDGELSLATPCPACGAVAALRPHVVWFGELPMAMDRIQAALETCDLFVSIGTSGNVYPAAGFVAEVSARGHSHTVELNLEPSEGQAQFAERTYGPATELVPAYVAGLLGEV